MKLKFKIFFALFVFSAISYSQNIISGRIIDNYTKLPLQNVNITTNSSAKGTVSNIDGHFSLELNVKTTFLKFSSIGYKDKVLSLKGVKSNLVLADIFLEEQPYSLDEITVNAGISNDMQLPITVSTVKSADIKNVLGDNPLPLITREIPGVYSTRTGGGSGDAKISIRGFQQENVSLLLNGIPINGQENGTVYWSNWLGLNSAAAEIQIQKGPGMANAAVNSIGGSINIITLNPPKERSGSVSLSFTDYGNINTNIALNSGKLANGWNTSLMLSYGGGSGYVDATYFKSWSYFFNAVKQIDENQKLSITLLGAPQNHGQRTLKLSNSEVEQRGLLYNKDWGSLDGRLKNASENFYHKPFLSINYENRLSENNKISLAAYASYGTGGGRWSESFNYAPSIFSYRTASGQIDWNGIYQNNQNHGGEYTLENGETVEGYSMNVQTNFMASHVVTGVLANYEHKFSQLLKLRAGLHYRYFNSFLREEVDDLLGGNYFIEDYSWSLAGVAGRDQIKHVGDIIRVDNNSVINLAIAYAQLIYSTEKMDAHISLNANNNWYQRIDRFNYINDTKSDIVSIAGGDLRAGLLYKFNSDNSLFINAATISKAPYFKFVFGNFTNVVVKGLENEKVSTVEIGYNLKVRMIKARFSAWVADRKNVSMLSNEYIQLEDNNNTRAMVSGLNALHKGIETEIVWPVNRNLNFGARLSLAEYKWMNNVNATLINDNNVVVDTVNVYAKGLMVGGAPKTQFGAFADLRLFNTFKIKAEYIYNQGVFANFDPVNRSNPDDMAQAYEIPAYGVVNGYLSYPFSIGEYYGRLQFNVYNLLDTKYIVDGEDGQSHNLDCFRGFWSFGRNMSFGLTFNF